MKRKLLLLVLFATTALLYSTSVQGQFGGGGGMGGGAMGGVPTPMQILMDDLDKNPVRWMTPMGEDPAWLSNGKSSVEATEALRAKLNETVAIESPLADWKTAREYIQKELGIQLDLNVQALENDGIDLDGYVPGLNVGTGPLREILRRALDPVNLTYRVCEGYLEITTKSDAIENPSMRFYDLGYIASSSKSLNEILNAITTSIDPDSWDESGGNCTRVPVGQILVIRTSEINHVEIEKMLARLSLSKVTAEPLRDLSVPIPQLGL